jgi:hypothetical protein
MFLSDNRIPLRRISTLSLYSPCSLSIPLALSPLYPILSPNTWYLEISIMWPLWSTSTTCDARRNLEPWNPHEAADLGSDKASAGWKSRRGLQGTTTPSTSNSLSSRRRSRSTMRASPPWRQRRWRFDNTFSTWKPEVEASINSVRLELSKLNKYFDCEAKESSTNKPRFLKFRSVPEQPPSTSTIDGPSSHHVEHYNRDCGFGVYTPSPMTWSRVWSISFHFHLVLSIYLSFQDLERIFVLLLVLVRVLRILQANFLKLIFPSLKEKPQNYGSLYVRVILTCMRLILVFGLK